LWGANCGVLGHSPSSFTDGHVHRTPRQKPWPQKAPERKCNAKMNLPLVEVQPDKKAFTSIQKEVD